MSKAVERRSSLAAGALLGGIASAAGIVLFAIGREKDAAALGMAAALIGGFVGFAQLYAGEDVGE